jgi:hypothetical protein
MSPPNTTPDFRGAFDDKAGGRAEKRPAHFFSRLER